MVSQRRIAVAGATGAQGGGLVRAILAHPSGGFGVRALTRDVNAPAAQALARAGLSSIAGEPVRYNSISPEQFRGLGFPGAEDLGNIFQFKRDFNERYCGARDLNVSRSLNPALQTYPDWLAVEGERIPVPKTHHAD